ncbi:MAG: abortive infection system antitoxin AbiGi family protein [Saprospiraceae bacterium]
MKDTISSNSLFHFTRELPYLKSILTEGFLPSYCLENFDIFKFIAEGANVSSFEMAVPMVCFCDIPLSKVKTHMTTYGHYGIGLSKDWGIKYGVSPLFYVSGDSATTQSIYYSLTYLRNHPSFGKDPILDQQHDRLTRLIRFTKPYKGKSYRNGKYLNNITFYNEREWRYIPDITDQSKRVYMESAKPWLDKETFESLRATLGENGKTQLFSLHEELRRNFPLKFEANTVRYIIVEKQSDVYEIVGELRKIYDEKEAVLLSSKILTKQQIFDDF